MEKNILFIIRTPGGTLKENCVALVPLSYLEIAERDLNIIDGNIINETNLSNKYQDIIVSLYQRFGLERSEKNTDLKKFLNPKPSFVVDKIITIGWAV